MSNTFSREKYDEFTNKFDTPDVGHDVLMQIGQHMQTQSDLAKRLGVKLKSATQADGADVDGAVDGAVVGNAVSGNAVSGEAGGIGAQARAIVDALYTKLKSDGVSASTNKGDWLMNKEAAPVAEGVPVAKDAPAVDSDSLTLDALNDGASPSFDYQDGGFPLESDQGEGGLGDESLSNESMSIDDFVAVTTREAAKAAGGAVASQVNEQMVNVLELMNVLADKVVAIDESVRAQSDASVQQLDSVKSAVADLQSQFGSIDRAMPRMASVEGLRMSNKSAGGSGQSGDGGPSGSTPELDEKFVSPLVGDTFGFANSW